MKSSANLGDEVKETVTGMKGIVTCESLSLSGCRQLFVQPREAKGGKPADGAWFDDSRVVVTKAKAVPVSPRFERTEGGPWHGPRPSTR